MPNLFPLAGSFLVPSYNVYYLRHWAQDREDLDQGGTQHELLLEYDRAMKVLIPGATYQYAGATASANYHNGDFGVKPGISHSTASLVTGLYALRSIFILSVNHQWSYEPTLDPNNEFWTTFSFVKKF
jgi:predicted class III extradiol MEMO1 family dioxygenase